MTSEKNFGSVSSNLSGRNNIEVSMELLEQKE
jgi:hypothetical protein